MTWGSYGNDLGMTQEYLGDSGRVRDMTKTVEMQGEQDFGAVFRSYESAEWQEHCLRGTEDPKI